MAENNTPGEGDKIDLDEQTRALLRSQGFDPDADPAKLISALSFELELGCDARLPELWRTVFGLAPMPGEPGFGPCSNKRRHFFTSIIGMCQRWSWPWHKGLTDAQIRSVIVRGAGPKQLPIGFEIIDGGRDA